MKKTLLFATLLFGYSSIAQVTFQTQTSGTSQYLQGIYFKNFAGIGTLGWAVGAGGTILQTPDDGVNWNAQTSGVTATLYSVDFVDESNGWACGSSGTVVATQNSGVNWGIQAQGAPYNMYAIDFLNLTTGYVVGNGFIATSTTGGNTWAPTMMSSNFEDVDFISSNIGWVCGQNGVILKTTDGGATWNQQTPGNGVDLFGIEFTSANDGWACGYTGTILHTSDGGTTWSPQTTTTGNAIYDIQFYDALNGWACGSTGTILKTTNGGTTWTEFFSGQTGTTASLQSISLISATEGWTVGQYGTIIHFTDAGSSASINENELINISIYPNPASSNITIESNSTIISVQIYDVAGALVQSESNNSFSVENLNSGVYTINAKTNNGIFQSKFVKQ